MLKENDNVKWTSQSAGYPKEKRGHIVLVVPAGFRPRGSGLPGFYPVGQARDHESYIVKVGRKHYWPLVKYLIRDEQG